MGSPLFYCYGLLLLIAIVTIYWVTKTKAQAAATPPADGFTSETDAPPADGFTSETDAPPVPPAGPQLSIQALADSPLMGTTVPEMIAGDLALLRESPDVEWRPPPRAGIRLGENFRGAGVGSPDDLFAPGVILGAPKGGHERRRYPQFDPAEVRGPDMGTDPGDSTWPDHARAGASEANGAFTFDAAGGHETGHSPSGREFAAAADSFGKYTDYRGYKKWVSGQRRHAAASQRG